MDCGISYITHSTSPIDNTRCVLLHAVSKRNREKEEEHGEEEEEKTSST